MSELPILSLVIFLPLAGLVPLWLAPGDRAARLAALAVSLLEVALACVLAWRFDSSLAGYQFTERAVWVSQWNIAYSLGADGLSLLMILLTAALGPLCVLISWNSVNQRVKEFHTCLLLMISFCIGVFVSLDLVLFYVFWEAMLAPMFLLIAVFGGPMRRYAAVKFFLYTMAGSALLLAAIVGFQQQTGSFSIPELAKATLSPGFQTLAFLAMALAFAVKMPMVPFHTWLPAAHVEAPTAGSVLLAAVLLKIGAYGFIRLCLGLTPQASVDFAPLMIGASLVSIIYGSFTALGQNDIKKLIAYSSIGHMGFVTLGIFLFNRQGLEGAIMQMLNHGVTAGALFMCVGVIYERTHSRQISDNMGLGRYLPAYLFFLGLFSLSALGFPGTNSFIGEVLVLIGAFKFKVWVGLASILGALLGAAYMLRLLQKMAWGEPSNGKGLRDLCSREVLCLAIPALAVLYLGFAPNAALRAMTASVDAALKRPAELAALKANEPETPLILAKAGLEVANER